MTIEARRIQRGVGASLLALALILIAAVPIAHADTIYPDNVITGSHFSTGLSHPPPGQARAGPPSATTACCCSASSRQAIRRHATPTRRTPPASARRLARCSRPTSRRPTASARCCSARRPSPSRRTSRSAPPARRTTFQFDRRADVQALLTSTATPSTRSRSSTSPPATPARSCSSEDARRLRQHLPGPAARRGAGAGGLPNVIAGNTYKHRDPDGLPDRDPQRGAAEHDRQLRQHPPARAGRHAGLR